MNLERLRHFVATVEAGTVSAAAGRVHLTQSALSRSLRQLESDLDVELFAKSGRKLALAPAGKALLPQARELLEHSHRAKQTVQRAAARTYFDLRLGAVDSVAAWLLPSFLDRLRDQEPELHVRLQTERSPSLVDAVGRDELDLAVVAWSGKPVRAATKIVRYDLQYYGRRDRYEQLADCRTEAELDAFPIISLHAQGSAEESADRSPERLLVSNVGTVKSLILAGLGVGHLPDFVLTTEERRRLVAAPIPHDPLCGLFLVTHPRWSTKGQKQISSALVRFIRGVVQRETGTSDAG